MSSDNDTAADDPASEESAGPVCGERLAEARRELKIAVLDIAKELHLDEFKVRALESNEFDVIGAPVFAKGHLRKYASLVGVDERDLMSDYYELTRASGAPALVPRRPRDRKVISPGPWIVAILVILLAAAAYWLFLNYESFVADEIEAGTVAAPQGQAVDVVSSVPAQPQAATNEDDANAAADDPASEANPPESAVADAATSSPEPEIVVAQPEPADAAGLQMNVSFSGDCWTEITDASGSRLFFELGKAGRTVNLTGEAPFNVLFGNADNVSLQVNGSPYAISPADRRGRTARLTITGS